MSSPSAIVHATEDIGEMIFTAREAISELAAKHRAVPRPKTMLITASTYRAPVRGRMCVVARTQRVT